MRTGGESPNSPKRPGSMRLGEPVEARKPWSESDVRKQTRRMGLEELIYIDPVIDLMNDPSMESMGRSLRHRELPPDRCASARPASIVPWCRAFPSRSRRNRSLLVSTMWKENTRRTPKTMIAGQVKQSVGSLCPFVGVFVCICLFATFGFVSSGVVLHALSWHKRR